MNKWAKTVYKMWASCVLLVLPLWTAAQENYQPLSGPSRFFESGGEMAIGEFIRQLFTWSIGLASVLTVFMIIGGGFKYLTSAATSASETKAAKEQIRNALLGLFLLIISVFILQTINPSLTKLDAILPEAGIEADTITSVTGTRYCVERSKGTSFSDVACFETESQCSAELERGIREGAYVEDPNCGPSTVGLCRSTSYSCKPKTKTVSYQNCSDCESLDDNQVTIKATACDSSVEKCEVKKELGKCINGFAQDYGKDGWQITEAWPPTVNHRGGISSCHANGSCVDANFINNPNPTPIEVADFIEHAHNNGLRAEYEIKGVGNGDDDFIAAVQAELRNGRNYDGDIQRAVIKVGKITAAHFSVYPDASQCR